MLTLWNRRSTGNPSILLLHPRGQARLFSTMLFAGLLLGWLSMTRLSVPLWSAAVAGLALLATPAILKWSKDREHWGTPTMVLSVLLATQTLHTVEHLAQAIQYHLLGWPLKASSGIISPLNAEIVHFTWNSAVLLTIIYLLAAEARNRWMWLLLIWAAAHTAEHTYMFINYLQEVERLSSSGLPVNAAQGLPGFLGKGGWLATQGITASPIAWLCTIVPSLTTAPRLDVHFWWNMGEVALLLPAAHASMRQVAER